jgi:GTP cyclohydrolase I
MTVHGDIMYFSCISVNVVCTMRGKVREVKLSSVIKNHLVKIYGRVEVAYSSTHSYTLR